MIGIINYGSGNIGAISNILEQQNINYTIITRPDELEKVSKLILPGVSSFDRTMELLEEKNLIGELNNLVLNKKVPIMGICVGMQILFEKSEEGSRNGLGWIKGNVVKINNRKSPHLGWNSISNSNNIITEGVLNKEGFYFLHSFKCISTDVESTVIHANYGEEINAIVIKNNIIGIQFHPEKSHSNGIQIFKNFNKL